MANDTPQKDGAPTVFGLVTILLIWLILGINLMLMFYYRSLADVGQVKQIACPDQKLCLGAKKHSGYGYSVGINFPSTIDGYTMSEQLSIPYFKSFDDPTESTFTITFDTDTTSVPSGGTKFMNITGAGYYVDTASTMTVYLKGVEGYTTLDTFVPELIREGLTSSSSDLRKKYFFNVNTIPTSGFPVLNLNIRPVFGSVSAASLSVSSSVSGSTVLSGTDSLVFKPGEAIDSGDVIDVYKDYQYVSRYNIGPAFSKQLVDGKNINTSCVDPGYLPVTCTGKVYDSDTGKWVAGEADPNTTYIASNSAWSLFDTDTEGNVSMCVFNKVEDANYYYGSTNNVYQSNEVAQKVMDNVLVDKPFSELKWTYGNQDTELTGTEPASGYVQSIVFCGGDSRTGTDNVPDDSDTGIPDLTQVSVAQNAVWPNNANAENNYSTFGFSSV